MFTIRDMKADDKNRVMSFVSEFYSSHAVDHKVPAEVLERTFEAAAGTEPSLRGIVFEEGQTIVGYAYLTSYFTTETGGKTLLLEEVYMQDSCRGKGYGSKFFEWMFASYPEVRRFRLEVTEANQGAVKLYEKLGFEKLAYVQMIKDME